MFQKTNIFFHRTLHNLKSIILRAGKKLPTPKPLFSCTFCRSKSNSLDADNFYASFLNIWESDLKNSIGYPLKLEPKADQEQKKKKTEACSSHSSSRDCDSMAKKIKEMYTIDTGDIEQALDVEEALHYYSRLRSPVYLNIVDNFFNDLYS